MGENFQGPCGQCSGKNDFGSWYVFPKEGQCQDGAPIGSDGCTWQVHSFKVIKTDCLKLVGHCDAAANKDYGHPGPTPWPDVQACIKTGVAGCPDVSGSRDPIFP